MEYYVFITNNCNLDCKYCSGVEINKNKPNVEQPEYSLESLKNFIVEAEVKHGSYSISIVFYGGEPTLNYGYLTDFINFFGTELEGRPISYVLHTNGILLDKIPSKLLKVLTLILVSINYDKIPRDKLFNSYFSRIIDNVRFIRKSHPVNLLARLTITEDVSLYTNVLQISNFFDYVHWQIMNCISFNDFDSYFSNYKYELALLFEHWYSYFKKGFFLNFIPFTAAVKFIYSNEQSNNFMCGFNTYSIYIQTDGKCYLCPEEMNNSKFSIGDVFNGIEFKNFSISNTGCTSCEFLTQCFGRCGRMHLAFDKTHIEEYCKLNKEMFRLFNSKRDEILNIMSERPDILYILRDPTLLHTEYIP